jgi:hypothetical protein
MYFFSGPNFFIGFNGIAMNVWVNRTLFAGMDINMFTIDLFVGTYVSRSRILSVNSPLFLVSAISGYSSLVAHLQVALDMDVSGNGERVVLIEFAHNLVEVGVRLLVDIGGETVRVGQVLHAERLTHQVREKQEERHVFVRQRGYRFLLQIKQRNHNQHELLQHFYYHYTHNISPNEKKGVMYKNNNEN